MEKSECYLDTDKQNAFFFRTVVNFAYTNTQGKKHALKLMQLPLTCCSNSCMLLFAFEAILLRKSSGVLTTDNTITSATSYECVTMFHKQLKILFNINTTHFLLPGFTNNANVKKTSGKTSPLQ